MIISHEEARDTHFWDDLYQNGGKTIYCNRTFTATNHSGLHVEHVYPASWMAAHFGCKNRDLCPTDGYQHAAADLHNLWPSFGSINMDRSNLNFGEIPGETNRLRPSECPDFERLGNRSNGLVEPRDSVKGDIARTLFYMELAYGLPIHRIRKLMLKWDKNDPVDAEEFRRNKEIKRIQKRSNPFIGKMVTQSGQLKHVRLEPTGYWALATV